MKKARRRRSRDSRRRAKAIGLLAFAALLALFWWAFGPKLRSDLGLAGDSIPDRDQHLRVVVWNLENFRGDPSEHDLDRLREVVEELDPDVLALQEINEPAALSELLPEFEFVASARGGRGHQRLAFGWRPDRVERLEGPREHDELTLGGRVRPGFSIRLRGRSCPTCEGRPEGPDLWLFVVHLKAMAEGIDDRREQWNELAPLLDAMRSPDDDLLVVGDFNTTGPPRGTPADEIRELARVLEPVGLHRVESREGCTAYYDGRRRDAWKEPSEIDHVWVRGLEESLSTATRVRSGTHCALRSCQPFRSTEAYPEPDYELLSDHCPLVLDLTRADDDQN